MHYVAIIGGKERQVEVTEVATDRYALVVDNQRWELDARDCGPSTWSLVHDTRSYTVELEKRMDGQVAHIAGHAMPVEILDLRRMRLRRAKESAAGPDGPVVIAAPMPGKVVALLAKDGQTVELGQGVVVVEAMKMENELRAPKAGVVRQLRVAVGTAVDAGAILCVIE